MFDNLIIGYDDYNWHKLPNCGWCGKSIKLTDEQYYLKGNICHDCSQKLGKLAKENETAMYIKDAQNEIKNLRKMMDRLGNELDYELTEEERLEIVNQMQDLFTRIKQIEKTM